MREHKPEKDALGTFQPVRAALWPDARIGRHRLLRFDTGNGPRLCRTGILLRPAIKIAVKGLNGQFADGAVY
jgi:hypothetical protein